MTRRLKGVLFLAVLAGLLCMSFGLGQPTPLSALGPSGTAMGPASQSGSLTLSPVLGPPGSRVTIAGTLVGGCVNVPLRVLWEGRDIVAEGDSGPEGSFSIGFTVPLDAIVGVRGVVLTVVPSACEFPDLRFAFEVTNPNSLGLNPAPAATSRTPVPLSLIRGPVIVMPSVDRGHNSIYVVGEPISYCVFVSRTLQVLLVSILPDSTVHRHYEGALAPGEFCWDSTTAPPLGWRVVRAEARDGDWVLARDEVRFLVTGLQTPSPS